MLAHGHVIGTNLAGVTRESRHARAHVLADVRLIDACATVLAQIGDVAGEIDWIVGCFVNAGSLSLPYTSQIVRLSTSQSVPLQ